MVRNVRIFMFYFWGWFMGEKYYGKVFGWSWELKWNVFFVILGTLFVIFFSKFGVRCMVDGWILVASFWCSKYRFRGFMVFVEDFVEVVYFFFDWNVICIVLGDKVEVYVLVSG